MIRENVPLGPLTYYKIGGSAKYYAQPSSMDDLTQISAFLRRSRTPYFVLGAGSNVLLDDQGFDGLIIHTARLDRTLKQEGSTITVGAGVMVIHLLRHCMTVGMSGLELLVGIPGNMGGVFAMNAGTKLGEIKDVVLEIDAYDLSTTTVRTIARPELKYSYRRQHFLKPHEIILRGKVGVTPSEPKVVQDSVQALLASRKRSQPIDKPSCGSVFKNPDPATGLQAWQLIEQAGLRGHRVGSAQISDVHTNFIVNLGGATAEDVKALIEEAQKRVKARFGIELETEVRVVPHDFSENTLAGC